MHIDQIRNHCLAKKGTTEEFPFDQDTLVFKVMNKMFVIAPLDKWERGEAT
ncbi:MAG: MmcQ/YjbR family DNA-binding protein, partial [Bacteroidia bacterium]|nr:MmcQ/YjbR family DNA-binding protein [Bacteroidia bacterium]